MNVRLLLPPAAAALVLAGPASAQRAESFMLADRQAIVEILRATTPGLPAFFQPLSR